MQLPRFRAESPCCSRHAAPCSRRLLPVVQRTQHALGTARAVEMRHNCAGASVNTSTETTQAVRACIGVRDLCVEAGAFGPNVQNVPRSEARVFQRGTAVEHGMPPSLTNMPRAQLHRPSTSWLTARTCLPGSACWAGGIAFTKAHTFHRCLCWATNRNQSWNVPTRSGSNTRDFHPDATMHTCSMCT